MINAAIKHNNPPPPIPTTSKTPSYHNHTTEVN